MDEGLLYRSITSIIIQMEGQRGPSKLDWIPQGIYFSIVKGRIKGS